jgi:hypothetical protein
MATTFLAIQQKVLAWLDQTEDTGRLRTIVKQFINDAYLTRCTEYRWPFMRTTYDITLTTATTYALPADYHRPLYLWHTTRRMHCTEVPDRMLQELGMDATMTPAAFSLDLPFYFEAGSLVLLFTPTAGEVLRLGYYFRPTDLEADDDLIRFPESHMRLLMWDAVCDLKMYATEMPELLPYWENRRKAAVTALYQAYQGNQVLGALGSGVHTTD